MKNIISTHIPLLAKLNFIIQKRPGKPQFRISRYEIPVCLHDEIAQIFYMLHGNKQANFFYKTWKIQEEIHGNNL